MVSWRNYSYSIHFLSIECFYVLFEDQFSFFKWKSISSFLFYGEKEERINKKNFYIKYFSRKYILDIWNITRITFDKLYITRSSFEVRLPDFYLFTSLRDSGIHQFEYLTYFTICIFLPPIIYIHMMIYLRFLVVCIIAGNDKMVATLDGIEVLSYHCHYTRQSFTQFSGFSLLWISYQYRYNWT